MPRAARLDGHMVAYNGPTMLRTQAMNVYKLRASDMDTLTPISEHPNPRGPHPIRVYGERDVRRLAELLGNDVDHIPIAPTSAVPLASKNGKRILYSKALKEYRLRPVDMDAIQPISMTANPKNPKTKMRYYNLCDVQELSARKHSNMPSSNTKTNSNGTPSPSRSSASASTATSSPSRLLQDFPNRPRRRQVVDLDESDSSNDVIDLVSD